MREKVRSAPIRVVILLVLVLLSVVIFLLWQNYIQQENQSHEPSGTQAVVSGDQAADDPKVPPIVIDEVDYSFTLVDGFNEVPNQLFEYTASLKAVKTFQNAEE